MYFVRLFVCLRSGIDSRQLEIRLTVTPISKFHNKFTNRPTIETRGGATKQTSGLVDPTVVWHTLLSDQWRFTYLR